MSVVIVGGHDRMVAQYKKICKSYKCKVKVFTHMGADFNKQIDVRICWYYLPIPYPTRWCAAHWMRLMENIRMWFDVTPAAETH